MAVRGMLRSGRCLNGAWCPVPREEVGMDISGSTKRQDVMVRMALAAKSLEVNPGFWLARARSDGEVPKVLFKRRDDGAFDVLIAEAVKLPGEYSTGDEIDDGLAPVFEHLGV